MGLFSVLTESTSNSANTETTNSTDKALTSGDIPTVVQLYAANDPPILWEPTPKVSGYSTLTYQAVQVDSSFLLEQDDPNSTQRRYPPAPDLGIWNCRVTPGTESSALVTALLATVPSTDVFVFALDLTDPSRVEPTLTSLQNALVRHLLDRPASSESPASDPDAPEGAPSTATTSLRSLQTTEFGKANEDEPSKQPSDDTLPVHITLVLAVQMPPEQEDHPEDPASYRIKQAQALVFYHLRKYAAALNCYLCFLPKAVASTAGAAPATPASQPCLEPATLAQYCQNLAMGEPPVAGDLAPTPTLSSEPSDDQPTPETVVTATPWYGPSTHQEDLIETVLLRTAHYPGHWDAAKDSLWKALPVDTAAAPSTSATPKASLAGDQGWLVQLRESIAAANDLPPAASTPERPAAESKPKEKDAEVTDFFASLLKKP